MEIPRTLEESIYRVCMNVKRIKDIDGIYTNKYRIIGTGTAYSMLGNMIRNPNSYDVGFAYDKASIICRENPTFNSERSIFNNTELIEIAKWCIPYYWPERPKLYFKTKEECDIDYKVICCD